MHQRASLAPSSHWFSKVQRGEIERVPLPAGMQLAPSHLIYQTNINPYFNEPFSTSHEQKQNETLLLEGQTKRHTQAEAATHALQILLEIPC